jgi:hypothetical protein
VNLPATLAYSLRRIFRTKFTFLTNESLQAERSWHNVELLNVLLLREISRVHNYLVKSTWNIGDLPAEGKISDRTSRSHGRAGPRSDIAHCRPGSVKDAHGAHILRIFIVLAPLSSILRVIRILYKRLRAMVFLSFIIIYIYVYVCASKCYFSYKSQGTGGIYKLSVYHGTIHGTTSR